MAENFTAGGLEKAPGREAAGPAPAHEKKAGEGAVPSPASRATGAAAGAAPDGAVYLTWNETVCSVGSPPTWK